jgi:hypothetical protein
MRAIAAMKSGLGYTWAAFCLITVLATFVGLEFWTQTFAKRTGIQVSARFSGGEVRQAVDHGAYQTHLHRMVFDGLIGERTDGFVQIDWVPNAQQSLPPTIDEDFDLDGDGSIEISVHADMASGKIDLLRQASWVLGLDPLISADAERILRVRLRNPRR